MTLKSFIWDTVSEGRNPSSKRVAGCLGWIVCLAASVIGIFYIIQSPDIIEMLFWSSCALLGIDSVAGAFKKNPFKSKRLDGEGSEVRDERVQGSVQ